MGVVPICFQTISSTHIAVIDSCSRPEWADTSLAGGPRPNAIYFQAVLNVEHRIRNVERGSGVRIPWGFDIPCSKFDIDFDWFMTQ